MRLNIFGLQPIIAPRDPVLPLEVATKRYVDQLVVEYFEANTIHITQEHADWLASITVTANEVNNLAGFEGNVKTVVDSKVNRSGDAMTGPLQLHGIPTLGTEAANKAYVDTRIETRLATEGGTMTGFLNLHSVPETQMQAATKGYVDTELGNHAADGDLHLSASERGWLNDVEATAEEINTLKGIESNVQAQIDTKFDKAGGLVTGNITLEDGKTVFVGKTPVTDTEVVNKAYVDALFNGREWKDPVTDINLLEVGLTASPANPVDGGTYITGPSVTGGLEPLSAYLWSAETNDYVKLQGREVQVGDRFAVGLTLPASVGSTLNDKIGQLVTVTAINSGVFVFEADQLTPGSTTLVFDPESPVFGVSYTYTDEGNWVPTNTSVNITAGEAIELSGNMLNVLYSNGLQLVDNALRVKVKESGVLKVTADGVELPLNSDDLVITGGVLTINQTHKDNIADAVSKTGGSNVTGNITVKSTGNLSLEFTPTEEEDAVNKLYVDNTAAGINTAIEGLDQRLDVLEEDPVTKTYTDTELAKKLNLTGGVMTGNIVLPETQTSSNQATTKGYVDDKVSPHVNNSTIHLTEEQNQFLEDVVASADEINSLVDIEAPVQQQLDSKLSLSGGLMTGSLELVGMPTEDAEAANKEYVDQEAALKVSKAGDTMTGALVLHADPATDLEAATKQYVDQEVAAGKQDAVDGLAEKLDLAGGTMTGHIVQNLAPEEGSHLTNKLYVDNSKTQAQAYADGLNTAMDARVVDLEGDVEGLLADAVTKTYVDDQDALKLSLTGGTMTGAITLHADPSEPKHAATKSYVDALAAGLKIRRSVEAATTEDIGGTYNNGSGGVNATLTVSGGPLVIDTVEVEQGDRVLVKNQTNKTQNGVYIVSQNGATAILTRSQEYDERHEIAGSFFFVSDGLKNKSTGWTAVIEVNPRTYQVGVDNLAFEQFSASNSYVAGDSINIAGNVISVTTVDPSRILVTAGGIDLPEVFEEETPVAFYNKVTNIDDYGRVLEAELVTDHADLGLTSVQRIDARLTSISSGTEDTNKQGLMAFVGDVATFRKVEVAGVGLSVDKADGITGNPKITSNATAVATPETVVARDANGDFAANEITADLIGNASSATVLETSRNFSVESTSIESTPVAFNASGDVVIEAELVEQEEVTAGEYHLVTVNKQGIVTKARNVTAIGDLGIQDVYTKEEVDAIVADLQRELDEFKLYILSRV